MGMGTISRRNFQMFPTDTTAEDIFDELGSQALNTPVLRVHKASSPGLVNVNCHTKAPLSNIYIQLKGKVTSTF